MAESKVPIIRAYPIDGRMTVYDLEAPGVAGPVLYHNHNVVTDAGRQRGIELISGLSAFTVRHVAIGDNGVAQGPPRLLSVPTAPTRSDVALDNEIYRKEADSILLSASVANEVIYTAEFLTADGPFAFWSLSEPVINEAGLFANADDTLFARRTFPSIPFDVGDRLGVRIVWHLQLI